MSSKHQKASRPVRDGLALVSRLLVAAAATAMLACSSGSSPGEGAPPEPIGQTSAALVANGGACGATGGPNCTSGFCDASGLCAACTESSNCQSGQYCNAGVCAEQKSAGTACTNYMECAVGLACSTGNYDSGYTGKCATASRTSNGEPCNYDNNPCHKGTVNGSTCDPNGNFASGTGCRPDTTNTTTDVCDGSGACVHTGTGSAVGAACTTGSTCVTGFCNSSGQCALCTEHGQCGSGEYCSGGACVGQRGQYGVCSGTNAFFECTVGNACRTGTGRNFCDTPSNTTNGTLCNNGNPCVAAKVSGSNCAGSPTNLAAGTQCWPDAAKCSNDVCDGSGTCVHNSSSCAANTSCNTGTGTCDACTAGTYANAGAMSCTACPSVTNCTSSLTCVSATSSQCTSCASGNYLVDNASPTADTCNACTAVANCTSSLTCVSATSSQCTSCATGYYLVDNASPTADTCNACTAIAHCSAGALSCTNASNSTCSTCATGYAGAPANCSTCAPGYGYSGGTCTPCAAGTYSAGGTAACTSCAAGTYSAAGASSCTACASGTFSAAGASSCTACTAVSHCSSGLSCTNASNSTCGTCDSAWAGSTCATCSDTGYIAPNCTSCSSNAQCQNGRTCNGYSEDFESASLPSGWTVENGRHYSWVTTTSTDHTGSYSLQRKYSSSEDVTAVLPRTWDNSSGSLQVNFWSRFITENCGASCGDWVAIEGSTDAFASDVQLVWGYWHGDNGSWTQYSGNLPTGPSISLRLRLISDSSESTRSHSTWGWWVDDLSVTRQCVCPAGTYKSGGACVTCANGGASATYDCGAGKYKTGSACTGLGFSDTQSCNTCGNGGATYTCAADEFKVGTACTGTGLSDTQLCSQCESGGCVNQGSTCNPATNPTCRANAGSGSTDGNGCYVPPSLGTPSGGACAIGAVSGARCWCTRNDQCASGKCKTWGSCAGGTGTAGSQCVSTGTPQATDNCIPKGTWTDTCAGTCRSDAVVVSGTCKCLNDNQCATGACVDNGQGCAAGECTGTGASDANSCATTAPTCSATLVTNCPSGTAGACMNNAGEYDCHCRNDADCGGFFCQNWAGCTGGSCSGTGTANDYGCTPTSAASPTFVDISGLVPTPTTYGCTAPAVCDPTGHHYCWCTDDTQCPSGLCVNQGQCAADPSKCTGTSSSPDNASCVPSGITNCTSDAQCGTSGSNVEFCSGAGGSSTGLGVCTKACTSNANCTGGETCVGGYCTGCTSAANCYDRTYTKTCDGGATATVGKCCEPRVPAVACASDATCGTGNKCEGGFCQNCTRSTALFPENCQQAEMSDQEKALEFMFFDLTACVTPDTGTPGTPAITLNPVTFPLDFTASCPTGYAAKWRELDWQASFPTATGSSIVFKGQTGTAGNLASYLPATPLTLATATTNTTLPNYDVVLLDTAPGGTGAFTTASPTVTSGTGLRIQVTMNPSTDQHSSPTLLAWKVVYDCAAIE